MNDRTPQQALDNIEREDFDDRDIDALQRLVKAAEKVVQHDHWRNVLALDFALEGREQ